MVHCWIRYGGEPMRNVVGSGAVGASLVQIDSSTTVFDRITVHPHCVCRFPQTTKTGDSAFNNPQLTGIRISRSGHGQQFGIICSAPLQDLGRGAPANQFGQLCS